MLKMKSGDTFPIVSGAFRSATHLILAICHPGFAAEGICALISLVRVSTGDSWVAWLLLPSVHLQEADYPRLRVVDDGRTWAGDNVQGQAEGRNSRRSGEQSGLAVPGAGTVLFLGSPEDQHSFDTVVLCVE